MGYLRAQDTLSGGEGKATVKVNDSVHELFYIKALEATMEKAKTEIKTIGKRSTQHKGIGWSGTGTMTLYYITSLFRKHALEYAKTGKDTYFTITVVNEDPSSSVGRQTIVLYNCNVDSTILAKLDLDSETLDEELPFTFDDFDILDQFGQPVIA